MEQAAFSPQKCALTEAFVQRNRPLSQILRVACLDGKAALLQYDRLSKIDKHLGAAKEEWMICTLL
jgi:hypothetical protein